MKKSMSKQTTEDHHGHAFINSVRFIDEPNIDWESYPFSIPAVAKLTEVSFDQPVTIFVGENGTGKSTIIEGLAAMLGINAEGGSKNFNFGTAQTHSILWDHLAANRNALREGFSFFLRAETMYNVFTERAYLDDVASQYTKSKYDGDGKFLGVDPLRFNDSYGNSRMHQMSHGESFFEQLLQFRKNGLYILDEPEAALSPNRQLATVKLLHDLAFGQSCQIFMAPHSPILLSIPGAKIYQLTGDGIEAVDYEDTDLFRTYWAFMKNPKVFLDRLFDHG
jgi:predicted ATPase